MDSLADGERNRDCSNTKDNTQLTHTRSGALTADKLTDGFDLFRNPVGFEGTVADEVMAAGESFHIQ